MRFFGQTLQGVRERTNNRNPYAGNINSGQMVQTPDYSALQAGLGGWQNFGGLMQSPIQPGQFGGNGSGGNPNGIAAAIWANLQNNPAYQNATGAQNFGGRGGGGGGRAFSLPFMQQRRDARAAQFRGHERPPASVRAEVRGGL